MNRSNICCYCTS